MVCMEYPCGLVYRMRVSHLLVRLCVQVLFSTDQHRYVKGGTGAGLQLRGRVCCGHYWVP